MNHPLQPQVDILVGHSLDSNGAVDVQRAAQVAQAFRSSRASSKIQTLRLFKQQLSQLQRRQQAVITSARPLASSLQDQLKKYIGQAYPQAKTFIWQTDPDLLGGFTILVGDMWHDSSIAHDLHTIREHLSQ